MTKRSGVKNLSDIWEQVPVDYYDQGVKNNLFQSLWHRHKWSVLQKIINNKKIKTILDVGCASGTFTNQLTQLFPKAKIHGVDIYYPAIKFAQQKYPQINFMVADAHQLPFKKNTFDLIICYETIEHVVDPKRVLLEIKKVLRKDGTAIVAMDSGSWLFRVVWWFWEKTKGHVWQGAHLHPFHHNHLEKVIKQCGFKIRQKKFSHLGMEVLFILKK